MSRGLEMGRHVPAHGTEADKSDFHAGMLLQVGDAEDIVAGSQAFPAFRAIHLTAAWAASRGPAVLLRD